MGAGLSLKAQSLMGTQMESDTLETLGSSDSKSIQSCHIHTQSERQTDNVAGVFKFTA